MPNDVPDWTRTVQISAGTIDIGSGNVTVVGGQSGGINVGVDAPPSTLGTATFNNGDSIDTLSITPPSTVTALVVLVYPSSHAPAGTRATIQVLGHDTGNQYVNETLPAGRGQAFVIGPGAANESGLDFIFQWSNAATATATAGKVFGLSGSGVQTVYGVPDQTLPVALGPGLDRIEQTTNIHNGTTSTTGDLTVATINIGTGSSRYLRRCDLVVDPTASVVTGEVAMYVKGVTSGNTQNVIEAKANGGVQGMVALARPGTEPPLDLLQLFPTDTQIEVHVVIPSGTAAGWRTELTA